jgi:hypothetical protein
MNINQAMISILQEISELEPMRQTRGLHAAKEDIGNKLIEIYYRTDSLRSRELIMSFMDHAGFNWVRKLITRDTDNVRNYAGLSTLDEYARLAAVNDPAEQWQQKTS